MPSQPNFVVIVSDQHSPHMMGCGGDPLVRTPNLDALAASGVAFDGTYCGAPLCVPSRMTFLTGRPCSDIGVWTNACMLPSHVPTFAHGLGAAGYETVLGGRMHFVGPDQRHGFERRIIGDVLSPFPGGPGPDLGEIPRGSTGQSRRAVEIAGPGRTAYQAYDVAVTDTCCEWLEQRDGMSAERPFCLVVGYVLPHCPFICPRELYEEYYESIELPAVPADYVAQLHPAIRHWRRVRGVDDLTPEEVRKARAAYYGLVTYMDEQIGRLLQTLSDTGFGRDTIVAYVSDHGEMAGEHGMWWKSSFYEGSARVPMIWSGTEHVRQGARCGRLTSLLDVGPTLLSLAGAPQLPDVAGRSLQPLLADGVAPAGWTDCVMAENMSGRGDERPGRMVRSGRWKLNHYHGYDRPQLFDLEADPGEWHDLSHDPAHAGVVDELLATALDGWDGDAIERELDKRRRVAPALRAWGSAGLQDIEADFWRAPAGVNAFPEE